MELRSYTVSSLVEKHIEILICMWDISETTACGNPGTCLEYSRSSWFPSGPSDKGKHKFRRIIKL